MRAGECINLKKRIIRCRIVKSRRKESPTGTSSKEKKKNKTPVAGSGNRFSHMCGWAVVAAVSSEGIFGRLAGRSMNILFVFQSLLLAAVRVWV